MIKQLYLLYCINVYCTISLNSEVVDTEENASSKLSYIDFSRGNKTILYFYNVNYFDKHEFNFMKNYEISQISNIFDEVFHDFVTLKNYIECFRDSYENLLSISKKQRIKIESDIYKYIEEVCINIRLKFDRYLNNFKKKFHHNKEKKLERIFLNAKKSYNLNGKEVLEKIGEFVNIDFHINNIEKDMSHVIFFNREDWNEICIQYIIFGEYFLYLFRGLYCKLLDEFGDINNLMNFLCNKSYEELMWSKGLNQGKTNFDKKEALKIFDYYLITRNDFYVKYKNFRLNYNDLDPFAKSKCNFFYMNTEKHEANKVLENSLLLHKNLLPQITTTVEVKIILYFNVDLIFSEYIYLIFEEISINNKIIYEYFCCLEGDLITENIISECWLKLEKSKIYLEFKHLFQLIYKNGNKQSNFLIIFEDISLKLNQKIQSNYFKYDIFIFSKKYVTPEFVTMITKANIGFIIQVFFEFLEEKLVSSFLKNSNTMILETLNDTEQEKIVKIEEIFMTFYS